MLQGTEYEGDFYYEKLERLRGLRLQACPEHEARGFHMG